MMDARPARFSLRAWRWRKRLVPVAAGSVGGGGGVVEHLVFVFVGELVGVEVEIVPALFDE